MTSWIDHERSRAGLPTNQSASGRVLTGVGGSFTAEHRLPGGVMPGDGDYHSHTWEVVAWFRHDQGQDARCAQAALRHLLDHWDGGVLPDCLSWAEDIAAAVGMLANCVAVEVSRPAERLYARWTAA